MARFASNDRINLKVGVSSHSEQLTSLEVVGRVGINSTISENALDVVGNANVDGNISVSGLSTFTGIVTTGGDLYVGGDLFVKDDLVYDEVTGRNINISGVATIGQTLDVNGNLDVDGHTELDNLNVSGVSTFQSHVHLGDDDELRFGANNDFKIVHDPNDCRFENSNGDIKFKNTGSYFFFDENGGETLASFINDGAVNLFYDGGKKFETTPTGVNITDDLNVAGVSTFAGNINASGNIVGVTSLTSISGINSVTAVTYFGDGSQLTGSGGGTLIQGISIEEEGSNVGTAGSIKIINFKGPGVTAASVNALKVDVTVDTGINTAGGSSFNDLNVTGVSTFAGNINANADINANGNIVGVTSLTSISGINSVTAVTYFGDGSNLSNTGAVLSAASGIQRLVATSLTTGVLTAAGTDADLTFNATTNLLSAGKLSIVGISTLADVNSSGVITATSFSGSGTNLSGIVTSLVAGANISISGATGQVTITGLANTANVTANTLVVSGFSTLASASFSGNVSIAGTLTYEDVTNIDSVGIITARAGIRIGTGGTVGPVGSGIVTYFGDGSQLSGVQGGKWEETDVGINTSSNVGIGTTNPIHKLEVVGDTNLTGNLNVIGITTINGNSVPSIGMVIALSGF